MKSTATSDINSTGSMLAKSLSSLPPLPATAQDILTCFGDEFIDADKVTAVVEDDPGICARLLGLANSAYFGLAEPVNRISEAISRVLGVETVRSLVLAMAIQQSFSRKGCPNFDTERFWTQSLLTAECCKKIAQYNAAVDVAVRDLAYSTGLCYNLGLLALVHLEPADTNRVLGELQEDAAPNTLAGLFRAKMATDHREMTALLASNWTLPAPMVAAYEYRADPVSTSKHPLGLLLAAGAAAVSNMEFDEDRRVSLHGWAAELDIGADDLQALAVFSDPQKERIQSLAQRMTR